MRHFLGTIATALLPVFSYAQDYYRYVNEAESRHRNGHPQEAITY